MNATVAERQHDRPFRSNTVPQLQSIFRVQYIGRRIFGIRRQSVQYLDPRGSIIACRIMLLGLFERCGCVRPTTTCSQSESCPEEQKLKTTHHHSF